MATATKWSNVQVALQSVKGSALTISAITKADPGVATSTAHGLSNGEYVLLDVEGMYQLDQKVVRVANVATDTFELEDVDTTNFDTFSSGSAYEITFGTTVGTIRTLSSSGGDFAFIDTTTIHDNVSKQIPGLPAPLSYTTDNIWDASDTALIAMKEASDNQTELAQKFTFANGNIMVFSGYVGASMVPTGSAQDIVTTPAVFTAYGTPTYYSS